MGKLNHTVSLEASVSRSLVAVAEREGKTRSEVVNDALKETLAQRVGATVMIVGSLVSTALQYGMALA